MERRDFLKSAAGVGATLGLAHSLMAAKASGRTTGRVLGTNDKINLGMVGQGGRGSYLSRQFTKYGTEHDGACKIVAVSDVYEKRKRKAAELYGCDGYLDYREVIARKDVDAIVIATL